jgi:hypothetical protein
MTAVEWLEDMIAKMEAYGGDLPPLMIHIKKAKEMEKQQQVYTEDDLREAFKQSRQVLIFEKDMPPIYESFEEWFEQFKKK